MMTTTLTMMMMIILWNSRDKHYRAQRFGEQIR